MTENEVKADVASLQDDLRDLKEQIQLMPIELKVLWADTTAKAAALKANTTESVHSVAQRVYAFIKTG